MENLTIIRVTDEDKFVYEKEIIDVEVDGLQKFNGYWEGTVAIETESSYKVISGQHGATDYEEEYGFILI